MFKLVIRIEASMWYIFKQMRENNLKETRKVFKIKRERGSVGKTRTSQTHAERKSKEVEY